MRRTFEKQSTIGAPSPLGTVVLSVCVGQLESPYRTRGWGVTLGYALAGYACRFAEPRATVREDLAAGLIHRVPFTRGGDVAYQSLLEAPERVVDLADEVSRLARSRGRIAALGCLDRDHWEDFERRALRELRRQFLRRGAEAHALPARSRAGLLVRTGYVLAILDELARESPAGRVDEPHSSLHVRAPIVIEPGEWHATARSMTAGDYGSVLEALIDSGVPSVLGATDDVAFRGSDTWATASSHARFGYALRSLEPVPAHAHDVPADAFSREALRLFGPKEAPRLVSDVVRYGYCGGPTSALADVPGWNAGDRAALLAQWCERRGDESTHSVEDITALVSYGYLLRRALELSSPGRAVYGLGQDVGGGHGSH